MKLLESIVAELFYSKGPVVFWGGMWFSPMAGGGRIRLLHLHACTFILEYTTLLTVLRS